MRIEAKEYSSARGNALPPGLAPASSRRSGLRPRPGGTIAAFTLFEIMIVISIIALIMTTGIPLMRRALASDDLARAMHDVMEGCQLARERAILQGVPFEFVLKDDGEMTIGPVPQKMAQNFPKAEPVKEVRSSGSLMAGFPRKLGEDVMVQLIDVNFVDHMDAAEAHVHFFPNGTSDEFTVVLAWKGAQRTVTLDVVTGMPQEFIK